MEKKRVETSNRRKTLLLFAKSQFNSSNYQIRAFQPSHWQKIHALIFLGKQNRVCYFRTNLPRCINSGDEGDDSAKKTASRVSGAAGVFLPAQLVRQPLPVRHPDQAVPARFAFVVLAQRLLRQEADQGGGRVGQLAPAAQHLFDRPTAAAAAASAGRDEQRRRAAGAAALVQRRPRGQQQQQPLEGLAAPDAQLDHPTAHDQRAGDAAAARRRAERAARRAKRA